MLFNRLLNKQFFILFPLPFLVACQSTEIKPISGVKKCIHTENYFHCVQYLKNYDGDTITFNIPRVHPLIGQRINVRIKGIDAPEMKGKGTCERTLAKRAKLRLENLLKNAKKISLSEVSRGKYFRIVAKVIVDTEDIGELLINEGLAVAYNGGHKESVDWCKFVHSPQNR